ncbi:MAG: LpxL/LpxP family Kdo(2)-lipid IV(A) lauroyl/palmitoleoyl acyltransferase [Gammaproteobacteria bacterium]|nr:LpxL/LpxP family Kdo(2)-lipid IV(A) lauroyl/palmitoleoyl acyltransferase [Pseudomonadales bacterium]MCP5347580.1 LpxL/LpxP family Kdo(2)-lipid IV(A) lauroyl/palmitoleoyl acyltransferase [Pseudomonadales bacterium]
MSSTSSDRTPLSRFYAPRYWPTWLGLWTLWLLAHLPFPLQIQLGKAIGYLSYLFARERREICRINLQLCFPELSESERHGLLRRTFLSNGIGVMEAAMSWCRNPGDFRDRVTLSGLENLRQARAEGRGVLLVCAHFTTLEFAGALLSLFEKMDVTYRKHNNPLFEAVMSNSRKRFYPAVIERENVRDAYRSLQQGHILWYAPDQDYGLRHSVFVPFFGVQAATITATARFARINDSAVVFFSHYRLADNSGYHLEFSQPLEDYPSGDEEADAARINQIIEQAIRRHPEQYLWLHKRFKTQAAGKFASPYPQKFRQQ